MTIKYLVEKIKEPIDVIALMNGGFGYANAIHNSLSAKDKESRLIEFYPLWKGNEGFFGESRSIDFMRMRGKYKNAKNRKLTDVSFEEFCLNPMKRFIGEHNSNNVALLVDDLSFSGVTLESSVNEIIKSLKYSKVYVCIEPIFLSSKNRYGKGNLEELRYDAFDSGIVDFKEVSKFNPIEDPTNRLYN